MNVKKIHWVGVGLSSPPGIKYLVDKGYKIEIWNRSPQKASNLLSGKIKVNKLNIENFKSKLQPNDLIVSMLPASMHLDFAKISIAHKCHFLTSSYYDKKYDYLKKDFIKNKNIFICEAGLDPGIDHLFASRLISAFKNNTKKEKISSIEFLSLCGGFPLNTNEFKYKFSWTPLGVLNALKSQAKYIKNYKETLVTFPFEYVTKLNFQNEIFETYPNRDSLPYIKEYQLSEYKNLIQHFERGTIRLNEWSKAWQEIFLKVKKGVGLEKLSEELWNKNQYEKNEKDRVLLFVKLRAKDNNQSIIFDKTIFIDESRMVTKSAMSQCVSYTVALTIECIIRGKGFSGINRIFHDEINVSYILDNLENLGIKIKEI